MLARSRTTRRSWWPWRDRLLEQCLEQLGGRRRGVSGSAVGRRGLPQERLAGKVLEVMTSHQPGHIAF